MREEITADYLSDNPVQQEILNLSEKWAKAIASNDAEKFMKINDKDEMQTEYDFRGKKGVRGKYYDAIQKGYTTIIHKSDGSTVVKETLPIFLDEDIQKYFPDSESVNNALRDLIALAPEQHN
jgi:hypothetical protein